MTSTNFRACVPTDQLGSWHFAVRWARMVLQQRIDTSKEFGLPTPYDELMLSRVESLESYLLATHDEYMDWLARPLETVEELHNV